MSDHEVSITVLEPGTEQRGLGNAYCATCSCGVCGPPRNRPLVAATDAGLHLIAAVEQCSGP